MEVHEEEVLARVIELLEERGRKVVRSRDFEHPLSEEDNYIAFAVGRENSCRAALPKMLRLLASTMLPQESSNREWEASAVAARVLDEIYSDTDATQAELQFGGPMEESRRRVLNVTDRIITEIW